jgi:excisionase family DNA binding protein
MTNPHAVSRRRPTRARPRLPRGPKSSKSQNSSLGRAASRQPAESGPPSSPAPASPPGESSSPKPSAAAKAFDWGTAKTLSVKEAAFRLNKSEDTVHLWLRAGRLRGWQLGGRRCAILVSEESVERALRQAGEIRNASRAAQSA